MGSGLSKPGRSSTSLEQQQGVPGGCDLDGLTNGQGISTCSTATRGLNGNNGLINDELVNKDAAGRGSDSDHDSEYHSASDDDDDDGEVGLQQSVQGLIQMDNQNRISSGPEVGMDPNRPRKLLSILKKSQSQGAGDGILQRSDEPKSPSPAAPAAGRPSLMSKWLPSWFSRYKEVGVSAIPGAREFPSPGELQLSFQAPGPPTDVSFQVESSSSEIGSEDSFSGRRDDSSDGSISSVEEGSPMEEEDSVDVLEEEEGELTPKPSTETTSRNSSVDSDEDMDPDDFAFKETLIARINKRKEGKTSFKHNEDDPRQHLDYNRATDTFSIGGIILIFDRKTLICSECDIRFEPRSAIKTWNAQMYNLTKNVSTHVNHVHLDSFQCTICQRSLSSWNCYKQHMELHLKDFQCKICAKDYNTRKALQKHELSHMSQEEKDEWMIARGRNPVVKSRKKTVKCPQCPKTFATTTLQKQHVRAIHGERKKVRCPDCRKLILEGNYRRYHRVYVCPDEEHENVARVQCPLCIDTLKHDSALRNHLRTVHAPHRKNELLKNGKYACTRCRRRFKTRRALAQHKVGAHGMKKE